MLKVVIKCSKTDLYRLVIYIGITNTVLCPVSGVMDYMLTRGSKEGPFYMWQDDCNLTYDSFVQAVRKALTTAEVEAINYAACSFAATKVAHCGL